MIILIVLTMLFIFLSYITIDNSNGICGLLAVIFGLLLLLYFICLPLNYYSVKAKISKFNATGATYKIARVSGTDTSVLEMAAIQMDVAKQNRWLANEKYWNNTIFDVFIPDEVDSLKPL